MTRRIARVLGSLLLAASMRTPGPASGAELFCPAPLGASCEKAGVGFTPQYPDAGTMPDYAIFTASLPGLGYQSDFDDDGSLANERCSANRVAGIGAGVSALATIVAIGVACDVAPENVDSGCFAAMAVLTSTLESVAVVDAQCSLQDGMVDGAEVEAAYENTKLLLASQIELSLASCTPLAAMVMPHALGGRAEEVRALVRRRLDQLIALGEIPTGVGRAQSALELADARLASGEYRGAFAQLCRAYKQLQLARR